MNIVFKTNPKKVYTGHSTELKYGVTIENGVTSDLYSTNGVILIDNFSLNPNKSDFEICIKFKIPLEYYNESNENHTTSAFCLNTSVDNESGNYPNFWMHLNDEHMFKVICHKDNDESQKTVLFNINFDNIKDSIIDNWSYVVFSNIKGKSTLTFRNSNFSILYRYTNDTEFYIPESVHKSFLIGTNYNTINPEDRSRFTFKGYFDLSESWIKYNKNVVSPWNL